MNIFVTQIINFFKENNINYTVNEFNSGATIIDFNIADDFYTVQIYNNLIGFSFLTNDEFSSMPDISFNDFFEFEGEIKKIIFK
ncbi:MAG: hypothetical protein ACO1PI_12555 [Bacteroidota bacterium]